MSQNTAYTPLIKNPEDIRCDTAVTLDLSPKIKNRHGMDEELKNECSEQNKGSRLRVFLRNKGFESIIQLLFGPSSLFNSSSLDPFSDLFCPSRSPGGLIPMDQSTLTFCPLVSNWVWLFGNRDISPLLFPSRGSMSLYDYHVW